MKKIKRKYVAILFALALLLGIALQQALPYIYREIPADRMRMAGLDIRGFQGTPAWELAKAVDDEDVDEIRRQVIEKKISVDYNDNRYKMTLLMLASGLYKPKSAKILLELGADPNARNGGQGTTSLMDAALYNKKPDIVRLLLKYGADPNAEANGYHAENALDPRETPLLNAVYNNLGVVKLLVDAGADIHYKSPTNRFGSVVNKSLVRDKYDIALYLLNKGADYNGKIEYADGSIDNVLSLLRLSVYDLNSEKYRQKMELVSWLKKRGLDYWKQPIPDNIKNEIKKEYPSDWEEYLKKY